MENKKLSLKETEALLFPSYKKFLVIVLSIFFAIYPFITYFKIMNLSGEAKDLFANEQGLTVDFFLYWKSAALVMLAVFLALFFIGEQIFPDHPIRKIPLTRKESRLPLICVGIYVLFVVLSTIFSRNIRTAWSGTPTSCEGMLVLLAYMVVFLAGLNYFDTKRARKILSVSLMLLVGVSTLLAFIEYLYKPILELPLMSYLIASSQYHDIAASLHNESFHNQVALSFYNPDYFGGFCVLLFPLTLSFIPRATDKRKMILAGLGSIMFFIALLMSRSSGATYAAVLSILLLLLLYRHHLKQWLPRLGLYILVAAIVLSAVHFLSGGRLMSSIIGNLTNTTTTQNTKEKFVLKDLSLDNGNLTLTGTRNSLRIVDADGEADVSRLLFYDENGQTIEPINDENGLNFQDTRFRDVHISLEQNVLILDLGYKDTIEFYITADGFKAIGQNGKALDSVPSLNPPLKGLYGLATGRGYTWVNSLPLLKDCLFIGKGPDNFAFSFPQNDIVGLLNTHESAKFVIDKPHNFYLQTGINTGVVSLISMLTLFVCYLIRGIRRYWQDQRDAFGIGIFVGVAAFLIIGLVNDSMVTVNPLFWLLLGVGYASLRKGREAPQK